jgi:tetratricopeptide (TPR) repeat protein
VRLEPSALTLVHRGRVLEARGAYELSIADFTSALETDPDFLAAHDGLGRALAKRGDLAKALAAYDRALVVNPGHAPTHYNRAIILQALGDKPAAAAALTTALRPDPALARSLPKELTALLPPKSPARAGAPRSR